MESPKSSLEHAQFAIREGLLELVENEKYSVQFKTEFKSQEQILQVVEILLDLMTQLGLAYNMGKCLLTQIYRSARVMKRFIQLHLNKKIEQQSFWGIQPRKINGTILLAVADGDVHDMGKNIVKMILQSNNYRVIDLGISAPKEKIIEVAQKENVDIIGLSLLQTPALEELYKLVDELELREMRIPLLVGGSATSRIHTALKVVTRCPRKFFPIVHILDAPRVIPALRRLLDPTLKFEYLLELERENQEIQFTYFGALEEEKFLTLEDARKKKLNINWSLRPPIPGPTFLGKKVIKNYPLHQLVPEINWNPFFLTWMIKGKFPHRGYPNVFKDSVVGDEARRLWKDANDMLNLIVEQNLLTASGVIGFYPANSVDEDIILYTDDTRTTVLATFYGLRQQAENTSDVYLSLADYVAPVGIKDYIGIFATSTGFGIEELRKKYELQNDDYSVVLVETLADRLAEAFAEKLHEEVRRSYWGYAKAESLTPYQKQKEQYSGYRPAPGYPSLPDHTEKETIWKLLNVKEETGMELTQSMAILPAAAVTGIYLSNSEAKHFAVGKITRDQVITYADRKGMTHQNAERWCDPILAYSRT